MESVTKPAAGDPLSLQDVENPKPKLYVVQSAAHDPPPIVQNKTSDPTAESAIIAFITGNHFLELEEEEHGLKPEHFIVTHWAIVYKACRHIIDKEGRRVCSASINDYIERNCLREFRLSLGHDAQLSPEAWKGWPQKAQEETGLVPSLAHVQDCVERVRRYADNREDFLIRQELADYSISPQQAIERWDKIASGTNGDLPHIEDSFDLCLEPDDTPPEIVKGIFHQGSKVMLSGGSKSFKTWQLLQLAVCVAAGHKWLQFPTIKGRVLYLNFSTRWSSETITISKALGITHERGSLEIWNLRGYAASGEEILPKIAQMAARRKYALIVLDPLYKLLGARDENSASDMSNLMNEVEKITVKTLAAIAFGTHFSKGNQSPKDAIDRMSGSGVLARDPDAILVSTEHKETNAFSVSMILRNLPPQEDFVMRFSAPIMVVDEELDPEELKQAKHGGGRTSATEERQVKIV